MKPGHGPPFADGSVSLRLYPPMHDEPAAVLAELATQAVRAIGCGFDGVMLSERHGGAWGQIPNPIQVAGWLLDAMPHGWAAPCPILLPFRTAGVVAEELAWLAARHEGRVGAGFGSGGNEPDFVAMGVPFDERAARFDAAVREVVRVLRPTGAPHPLAGDRAIARAREHLLPLISAVMSANAARRASELGIGIIGSSLLSVDVTRRLYEVYRDAGGRGPHVVIVRVWLGQPPWDLVEHQLADYQAARGRERPEAARGEGMLHAHDAAVLAELLVGHLIATSAHAANVRVHVAGLDPSAARAQIERIGAEVLPLVRAQWSGNPTAAR